MATEPMVTVPRRLIVLASALLTQRMPCMAPDCVLLDDEDVNRIHAELEAVIRDADGVKDTLKPGSDLLALRAFTRSVRDRFFRDQWPAWTPADDFRGLLSQLEDMVRRLDGDDVPGVSK